jgi:hypothetical protein
MGLSKYNDGIKYIFNVIDLFSKYLHVVPLKSKIKPSVTASFQSLLKDDRYSKPLRRRPVWLQTDRGKEFSNRPFQDMLKGEGIHFHVCRNPDVKYGVMKRGSPEINCTDTLLIRKLTDSSMSYRRL